MKFSSALLITLVFCCLTNSTTFSQVNQEIGSTVQTRFTPPKGYTRTPASGFQNFLRNLPLKNASAPVLYFNGQKKDNQVHAAVIDLDVGTRDLQQCADAIMRLRAEYLYETRQFDKIHFNFTNGFRCDYSEWMKGKRIHLDGNKTTWVQKYQPSNNYKDFRNYLTIIFSYAGTLSLSKELQPVVINELEIGDVFIQGGSPGHAIIVVDVAINPITKEKIFILAQSYMPAQDIHILINLEDSKISPWYDIPKNGILETPEWVFNTTDLRRF